MEVFVGKLSKGSRVILEQAGGTIDGSPEARRGRLSSPAANFVSMGDICNLEIEGAAPIKIMIEHVKFRDGVGTVTFRGTL
jgi:hypothetical protein